MSQQVERLFVYGTLMPGQRLHGYIEQHVRSARPGLIHGRLVDLGHFPGLVLGDELVRGVLLDVAPEALAITDRIEGYGGDPRTSFYIRKRFGVHLSTGEKIDAWAYELANPETAENRPPLLIGRVDGRRLYAWAPSSEGWPSFNRV